MNIITAINTSLTDLERSDKTISTYRLALNGFAKLLETQGTSDATTLNIQHFIDYALSLSHNDYAKSTVQTYMAGVAYFLNWLMLKNYIQPTSNDLARFDKARKDVARKRKTRIKKVPSNDTVSKMLAAVYTQRVRSPIKERDIAILNFLVSSGARISDLVYMTVKDIDFVNRKAHVIGKGDKERYVRFSSETAKWIETYWTKRGWTDPDDPAFANHSRKISIRHLPMGIASVENVVKAIAELAGVKGITPHKFRSYFITKVYRETNDIALAQKLAGHESIITTRGYMDLEEEEVKDGYDKVFD